MLVNQNDPIKTSLITTTTSRGQSRQQITLINIIAHTRSVLGSTYWLLMTSTNITQPNANTTPLRYDQTKRLVSRPIETIAWATSIMAHPDIFTSYEEGLKESEEEQHQANKEQHPPNNTANIPPPTIQRQRGNAPPWKGRSQIPSSS